MRKITSSTPRSHRSAKFAATAARKISACIPPAALLAVVPMLSGSASVPSETGGSLSELYGQGTEPFGEVQLYCGFCIHTSLIVDLAQHFAISDTEDISWGGHHGPSVDEDGADPDGYHPLWLPDTCIVHGFCGYAAAEMEPSTLTDMIAEAVMAGEASLTRLAGMPGVAVNASRGAIQVAGCDGATIVGHVPVVHIFENHRGRTLLAHDFNVLGTDRFPGQVHPGHAYATDSESIVMMADIPTPEAVGHNLHVLNRFGEMVSFGGNPNRAVGFYVTGDREVMWALQGLVNRVVRWRLGAEPRVVRTIARTVEAFDRDPH